MGSEIVEKQKNAHWGDGFLKQLSNDLMSDFPDMKGFSYRNLKFIRQWHSFYNDNIIKGKQVVSQFEDLLFSIPWGHHILIMQRCKNIDTALFYIQQTVENNWSRNVLDWQIDSNLYERKGSKLSNFSKVLPNVDSDLANQIIKNPYNFDFLSLSENYKEKVIKARDIDSQVTGRSTGHPIRVLRNPMTKKYLKMEAEGASFEELEMMTLGALKRAVVDGDVKEGSLMAGQIAGLLTKRQSCKEIIEEMMTEAVQVMKNVSGRF